MSCDVAVAISANAEWRVVKEQFPRQTCWSTPYGEAFEMGLAGKRVLFFHGGWGKIAAAASTQYALARWSPRLLVNLGTCGGFAGRVERWQVLLVERTLVYDILEQMGDPVEAIRHYTVDLDLAWLRQPYPQPVLRSLLVSGDRDIWPPDLPGLVEQYGAVAADWESGAIAWVAKRNAVRCLILRGVSDLVSGSGGEAYNGLELFHNAARQVMVSLLDALPAWLEAADAPA